MSDFKLIETFSWKRQDYNTCKKGFYLLDLHLERIGASARFFNFEFNKDKMELLLQELELTLLKEGESAYKVRLLLEKDGQMDIDYQPLPSQLKEPVLVDISPFRVRSDDIFLYHKTTARALFDQERERLGRAGLFETIFLNEHGQLTQGTITNIFLDLGGNTLRTPSLSCGLLPGTLRRYLLDSGKAEEQVMTLNDLKKAQSIFVGNSVRGLLKAKVQF